MDRKRFMEIERVMELSPMEQERWILQQLADMQAKRVTELSPMERERWHSQAKWVKELSPAEYDRWRSQALTDVQAKVTELRADMRKMQARFDRYKRKERP